MKIVFTKDEVEAILKSRACNAAPHHNTFKLTYFNKYGGWERPDFATVVLEQVTEQDLIKADALHASQMEAAKDLPV